MLADRGERRFHDGGRADCRRPNRARNLGGRGSGGIDRHRLTPRTPAPARRRPATRTRRRAPPDASVTSRFILIAGSHCGSTGRRESERGRDDEVRRAVHQRDAADPRRQRDLRLCAGPAFGSGRRPCARLSRRAALPTFFAMPRLAPQTRCFEPRMRNSSQKIARIVRSRRADSTRSVGPCSTIRPARMTMTRSHRSRTTLRSWDTNR